MNTHMMPAFYATLITDENTEECAVTLQFINPVDASAVGEYQFVDPEYIDTLIAQLETANQMLRYAEDHGFAEAVAHFGVTVDALGFDPDEFYEFYEEDMQDGEAEGA